MSHLLHRYRPMLIAAALAAVMLLGFFELAEDFASSPAIIAFDQTVHEIVLGWRFPPLTAFMTFMTAAGDTPAVALAAVVLATSLASSRRRFDAVFAGAVVAFGGLVSSVTKRSFARARPPAGGALIELPGSFSFPSGHTLGSLCLAFVLGYLVVRTDWNRWLKALGVLGCGVYALTVGVSRVYLGVHWTSDVLASWLLGGALVTLAVGFHENRRYLRTLGEASA